MFVGGETPLCVLASYYMFEKKLTKAWAGRLRKAGK
jgi:hypothetical protein